MALRGTLKDFGIADIFQLIGHQVKTGVLAVRNRDQDVQIFFKDGSVVRAESSTRQKKDLLGAMLVRAEVVSEAQLNQALDTQKKTLRRLGDILVDHGAIDAKTLRAFTKLQTTETIYRLFLWDVGTYEFSQVDVALEPEAELIRSENVLMEGFRQVDEWPMIRRKITGYGMTFEKLEDLDALVAEASSAKPAVADESDDLGLEDVFGDLDEGGGRGDSRLKNIGQNERIVYQLIVEDRDVQKIIDLSRLGEFETCQALVTLIDAGIIQTVSEGQRKPSAEATVGGILASTRARWTPVVTRVLLYLTLGAGALFGAWNLGFSPRAVIASMRTTMGYTNLDIQEVLSRGHLTKLRAALEVYRAEQGTYPPTLARLVEVGLLHRRDLYFPWQTPYFYARNSSGYELLRPLY